MLDGFPALAPATTFVISVEGVSANHDLSISGAPVVGYRLSLAGMLLDDQGGVWGEATALRSDAKGATSIAFVLEENVLMGPVHFLFKNIEVCQYVSDGPGEVKLNVQLFLNTQPGKTLGLVLSLHKAATGFDLCPEHLGNLPIRQKAYQTFIINPHEQAAVLTIGKRLIRIEPKARLDLEGDFSNAPHAFSSSLALPLVLLSDLGDLNLVGLNTANHRHWLIPHLARDDLNWTNRWIFANGQATTLALNQAGDLSSTAYQTGVHDLALFAASDSQASWLQMAANRSINGFFEFAQTSGNGSAWVNAKRATPLGDAGDTVLYLPHVARDTANFWTGYSLANRNDTATEVVM